MFATPILRSQVVEGEPVERLDLFAGMMRDRHHSRRFVDDHDSFVEH